MILFSQASKIVAFQHDPGENPAVMYLILKLKALKDSRGQDLIEYALMAGFVAVAAGAVMPNIFNSVLLIMAKVWVVLDCASGGSEGCNIAGEIF